MPYLTCIIRKTLSITGGMLTKCIALGLYKTCNGRFLSIHYNMKWTAAP